MFAYFTMNFFGRFMKNMVGTFRATCTVTGYPCKNIYSLTLIPQKLGLKVKT